jgi:hypothetical protein
MKALAEEVSSGVADDSRLTVLRPAEGHRLARQADVDLDSAGYYVATAGGRPEIPVSRTFGKSQPAN